MTTLHRSFALAVAAAVIGTSSGCSIIDRLFLLNADGPYAHQAQHVGGRCRDGNCQPGECQPGECEDGSCPTGACQECEGGACHPRHVGRYGGLAKHHLSPEEKAALAGSNYGAIGPAGPPTGAVAYPYYTTRGPRDFLAKCPPSIGPQ
jgi:hypothetical protein